MAEVRYLTADEVLAIADHYLRTLGYAAPVLRGNGRNLLESAVYRAQTTAHYGHGDLLDQAAALCNGIALNHPFADGNKRSAFAACLAFLDANGLQLPANELVSLAEQLIAQHELTYRTRTDVLLADWLRARTSLPP